jgi:hypothetical protein
MSERDRIAAALLSPFEVAAARARARYQPRLDEAAELARRQAIAPAPIDPKYLVLPASENVVDRTGEPANPLRQLSYKMTGFAPEQLKQAWDYLTGDPAVKAEVDRSVESGRATPNWRQRVPDDLSGDLPSQIGFFDMGNWHTGGIGSR